MRLRNKRTGEIPEKIESITYIHWSGKIMMVYINSDGKRIRKYYDSFEDFSGEWEDYEPKGSALDLMILTLTNFIENEPDEDKVDLDDCKQLLEKLKAWQRLKDKGFRFTGFSGGRAIIEFTFDDYYTGEPSSAFDDLDLLFGGKE